ncbi:phenylpropionate dioxygenase-like ring-hydroxylating dioxygenase large terminal subunit [Pseudomonas sp. JAI111]|uniref:aromatic ring-hydroxylating oxygenase subunit alpha n=1 Tax=Pseudomonas sp. JAI111 TaxID=2735913 RepID=UPI0021687028|nr:aromatic ring-hydroxylating dioxygenase subunit alpha [Pseudomonas sp. JAI111]MCS3835661.1 phenylpropionate dioxygenase-like ring-hydroxylating dioxygenase large terminal subunit [Pseudomonas sp. JAI111]
MSGKEQAKHPTLGIRMAEDAQRPIEGAFATRSTFDMGTADLPVERYISRSFHEREMLAMWPHVWQMACHEGDIPEVGDYITYEIGNRSFIVVRVAEGEIKSYPNACLHRAMRLVKGQGKAGAFTCPFHGWSWGLDGCNRRITEDWDFPQTCERNMNLPEARVGTWGGFVFINPDADGKESFEDWLGVLPAHFKRLPLEDFRVAVHVARIVPGNWKVAMEAFIESYHVMPTHPQSVPVSEYAETQYDIFDRNVSRLATVSVAQASGITRKMSQQEFADYAAKGTGREPIQVPDGMTYRSALADQRRQAAAAAMGKSLDHLNDVELLDAIEYFLFPNFMPWYGMGLPIVYRFRPNKDNHDSCIMEVYVMTPRNLAEAMPRAPAVEWLPEDKPFVECAALGRLGPIFDQDYDNIEGVWMGLQSTVMKGLVLASYQEARIRHYHSRIDDFINAQEK